MSKHLSQDQFARCLVGRTTSAETRHLNECPECSAEFDAFGRSISSFRNAIRAQVDVRIASPRPVIARFRVRPAAATVSKLRWALVVAGAFVLAVVPFLTREEKRVVIEQPATAPDPNTLMENVNRHLSRTIPAPMEPMMALIPNDDLRTKSGGVQ